MYKSNAQYMIKNNGFCVVGIFVREYLQNVVHNFNRLSSLQQHVWVTE